jgi:hypothetical protein
METILLYINLTKSLTMRSTTTPKTWSRLLFTKIQLLPRIFLLSHFSLEKRHRLMNEEKGKNREFWLKTHNLAANSWGKGGK